jgi:hypothetical protein
MRLGFWGLWPQIETLGDSSQTLPNLHTIVVCSQEREFCLRTFQELDLSADGKRAVEEVQREA